MATSTTVTSPATMDAGTTYQVWNFKSGTPQVLHAAPTRQEARDYRSNLLSNKPTLSRRDVRMVRISYATDVLATSVEFIR